MLRIAEDADETVWAETIAPVLFGEAYRTKHPDRIQALARWRARYRPDPCGVARQWEAWEKFDMSDRLSEVTCPVLVLHGSDDGLSPIKSDTRWSKEECSRPSTTCPST